MNSRGFRFLYLMVALLVPICAGCASQDAAPPPSAAMATTSTSPTAAPPLQTVAIGDEYTAGSPVGGLGTRNWTFGLQRLLGRQGVDSYVRNFASPGTGYTQTTATATTFGEQVRRGVNNDTDLVILAGGGNDVAALPSLFDDVLRTVSEVRAGAPMAQIIIVGPQWSQPGPPDEGVVAASEQIRAAADEAAVPFVDPIAEQWFVDDSLVGPDQPYPNDAGHAAVADRLAGRAAEALERAGADPPG